MFFFVYIFYAISMLIILSILLHYISFSSFIVHSISLYAIYGSIAILSESYYFLSYKNFIQLAIALSLTPLTIIFALLAITHLFELNSMLHSMNLIYH
jgi:hypothetical protein